jgi:hypothetical protein
MKNYRIEPAKVIEIIHIGDRNEAVAIGDRTGRLYRAINQKVAINERVIVFERKFDGSFYFEPNDELIGW